ncbi:excinuclease ABC subunit C [Geothermobacter ehrlichii]|uniref:UvrABC system protein C n=1 Tax=Geothermobacter ehrlichii TaxID=213224 RepID=A0A5D3WLI4_9BACT|nr:excinuclease ABC subunit UvrC [Geothermobacter ehrlichii]TYO98994.1 excinuclease ABC subunit C [Geothermobacter ehrlichii]
MSEPFTFRADRYPNAPGVYLMKDGEGTILYIGKANNLRNRLRSYFSTAGDGRYHIRFLVDRVRDIDTIVTDTGKEALILENTLIKRHRPRYNINLRDDKTYVSLRIDLREEFPTLEITRRIRRDGARYFGPYASAGAVRQTLKQIYRIFPLRHSPLERCRQRGRPCLYYQIGQCSAPCHGLISPADYRRLVEGALALLDGRGAEIVADLSRQMQQASAEMRFEDAAKLRDRIRAIETTIERQKVAGNRDIDQDVFGLYRDGGQIDLVVLFYRHGQLISQRGFTLDWQLDSEELLASFLRQFYNRELLIPDQILLPFLPEDCETLRDWLQERKGRRVEIAAPQRGERAALVAMAERNAEERAKNRADRRAADQRLLAQTQQQLHLKRLPRRIECFDISTFQGAETVGSMAVIVDGEPARALYRRYRIRSVSGTDDFGSLREVLSRRLQRGLREDDLPDLLLIDGGRGQLSGVVDVLDELGLRQRIDVLGIAKSRVVANARGKAVERSEERFFLPGRKNPVTLRQGSPVLFLLQRLRDEAHRFAIDYHRKLRRKHTLRSSLENIPGVGPTRRKLLLKHFGSLKGIRSATLEELRAVPGLPRNLAETVFRHFHD